MITHYLKIAERNLLKYKVQSIISIFGLAVGFVCFALSAYWIRYEMTYDHFHEGAERIYLVRSNSVYDNGLGIDPRLPYPTGKLLKEQYPEIESYATFTHMKTYLQLPDRLKECEHISTDSSFVNTMGIRILKGNANFMQFDSKQVAITEAFAEELFPGEDPIGKEIHFQRSTMTVCAVVSGWNKHSNFHYDLLGGDKYMREWGFSTHSLLVKLKKDVDAEVLLAKMNRNFPAEVKTVKYTEKQRKEFFLTPLTSLHYDKTYIRRSEVIIAFDYIVYFSVAGILIIVCALVNYLLLFFNRLRTRHKEMVLRKVNGASGSSLIFLLLTEFALTLVAAILVGMTFIEVLLPSFLKYSGILAPRQTIYGETFTYFGVLSIVAVAFALIPIYRFQKRTLKHNLKGSQGNRSENLWRKISIGVQLTVCLAVISGTVLMNKQIDHLKHADLGMEHKNIGSVAIWMGVDMNTWMDRIKNLPMVTEVLPPKYYPLVGTGAMAVMDVNRWDGQEQPAERTVDLRMIHASEEFCRFYGMTLLAGEWITEKSTANEIVINEGAAREMGWTVEEAVGKHIYFRDVETYTVIGVAKDAHYISPTVKTPLSAFINTEKQRHMWQRASILFKYKEGTWNECRTLIEDMHRKEHPDKILRLYSEEEEYAKLLRSEDALRQLLSFASLMCIVISLFGIYSLLTLTCEQRRKEIAIRKVNGATVKTIFGMFFREYLTMLTTSAVISFPITYVIVKKWIEGYNRQTDIGIGVFMIVFIGLAIIVSLTIGWRVWRTANENPAEVIKQE